MFRVLYLDTNHLSSLARFPERPDCQAVRDLLRDGSVRLALTFLHLQELGAPTFKSRGSVGELLDDVPVAWAPPPNVLMDEEVRAAIRRATTGSAEVVRPFGINFAETLAAPAEANIPISEMLEAMASHPTLRSHLQEAAAYGAAADQLFGRDAAVIRDPTGPIVAHIRELNASESLFVSSAISPEEIFSRAGGSTGFPANNVAHGLARTRLKDESFPCTPNDMIDEWHALYAPYCAAMALDRRTSARLGMTRLVEAARVSHRLLDVPALLALTAS